MLNGNLIELNKKFPVQTQTHIMLAVSSERTSSGWYYSTSFFVPNGYSAAINNVYVLSSSTDVVSEFVVDSGNGYAMLRTTNGEYAGKMLSVIFTPLLN